MEFDLTNIILEIKDKISQFNNVFDTYVSINRYANYENPEDEFEEKKYYEEKMQYISTNIHFLFLTLFDLSNSVILKSEYDQVIKDRYKSNEEIIKGTFYDLADDYFSDLSGDFYNFIYPFEVLIKKEEESESKDSIFRRNTLERLLEETNLLCKLSSVVPTSEPQVYNTVKNYLYILFPKANNVSGQSFPSVAKVYKPDIIVPDCNAVIEYKYIDKKDKITSTIAGISDDVKGYTEDTNYNYFYAVFYFKIAYMTKERFLEIWTEKNFPSNWKPIYILESL